MNIANTVSVINMIATLSSTTPNLSVEVAKEIDARILELAKAIKFKEADLEQYLNKK